MSENFYIISTNALDGRHYFAGRVEENFIFPALVLTKIIFDAYDFENKDDAEDCIKALELGDKWEVSECSSGISEHLDANQPKETKWTQ